MKHNNKFLAISLTMLLLSSTAYSQNIDPQQISYVFEFIRTAPKSLLQKIENEFRVSTDLHEILVASKPIFNFFNINNLGKAKDDVIKNYITMNNLDSYGTLEARIEFINSLTSDQIKRIYNVREIYGIFSRVLALDRAPSLKLIEMDGVFRGRSSIWYVPDQLRTFRKVFYKIEKNGKSFAVGHNISNMPKMLSSDGCFRIYENRYPVYNQYNTEWKPLQNGTISLSYEIEDLEPVEGLRYKTGFPRLTNYRSIYIGDEKMLSSGASVYSDLKDQMFKINDRFYVSHAFRSRGVLPETYFILTWEHPLDDLENFPL